MNTIQNKVHFSKIRNKLKYLIKVVVCTPTKCHAAHSWHLCAQTSSSISNGDRRNEKSRNVICDIKPQSERILKQGERSGLCASKLLNLRPRAGLRGEVRQTGVQKFSLLSSVVLQWHQDVTADIVRHYKGELEH